LAGYDFGWLAAGEMWIFAGEMWIFVLALGNSKRLLFFGLFSLLFLFIFVGESY